MTSGIKWKVLYQMLPIRFAVASFLLVVVVVVSHAKCVRTHLSLVRCDLEHGVQLPKNLICLFFRYQRGSRSLAANLSMSQSATATDAVTPDMDTQEQEEDYDIPEEVETVIGALQPALSLNSCCNMSAQETSICSFDILQSICWWD